MKKSNIYDHIVVNKIETGIRSGMFELRIWDSQGVECPRKGVYKSYDAAFKAGEKRVKSYEVTH